MIGVVVRKEAKPYGLGNLLEGRDLRGQSVVIVDDCTATGTALYGACRRLEANGVAVEGVLCVVDFPSKGGTAWARANGLKVSTLIDGDSGLLFRPVARSVLVSRKMDS